MAATQMLSAFYIAVLLTAVTAAMGELPRGERKHQQIGWKALKRWTLRLAVGCILLSLVTYAFYVAGAPSFAYVDGGWVAASRDGWHVAFLAVIDLGVLALLLDRLVLVVRNPRASLVRRLARSTALVLAATAAFAGFYFTHLTS
jgi:hypothetical protein